MSGAWLDLILWWGVMLLLGIAFFPLARRLFSRFPDGGWIFSKVFGLVVTGYVVWALSCAGILPFSDGTARTCAVVIAAAAFLIGIALQRGAQAGGAETTAVDLRAVLFSELLFVAGITFWAYVISFHPDATQTEKFMDFGFMAAMDRSRVLPAPDMWLAGERINYYYGGQYFAVFLAKLTGTGIGVAYNAMRAVVSSLFFVMPYALVRGLSGLRQGSEVQDGIWMRWGRNAVVRGRKKRIVPVLCGLLAGALVSVAGNVHYLLYGLFGKVFRLSGYEDYWFPSSTRYIGHNPATDDACIHEFPSYSSVLGDLHAHMVNLIFVLLFLALFAAWMTASRRKSGEDGMHPDGRTCVRHFLREAFPPVFVLGACLVGMFRWTNYWDYVIYLTVLIFGCVLQALYAWHDRERTGERTGRIAAMLVARVAGAYLILTLVALPFTLTFDMMVSSVAFAANHTAPYQFLILWGLPILVVLLFGALCARDLQKGRPIGRETMLMLLFAVCAVGLIILPELVYVKDIYDDGASRSNTMFKLTYQAFTLFGLVAGYALPRMLAKKRRIVVRIAAGALLAVELLTCLYLPYAIDCWFGDVQQIDQRRGLDATAFLERDYPGDAGAIRYLQEEIEGTPVVLEAPGDSYSDYDRVSAMTGLPTVLGWYVHEWLWRDGFEELNLRSADVEAIYTAEYADVARRLLAKYQVEYLFIGSCEREKYGDALSEQILRTLGTVVYDGRKETGDESGAVIIRLDA